MHFGFGRRRERELSETALLEDVTNFALREPTPVRDDVFVLFWGHVLALFVLHNVDNQERATRLEKGHKQAGRIRD